MSRVVLGASPGASTAVATMVDLLARCFPGRADDWRPQLHTTEPSLGSDDWDRPLELTGLTGSSDTKVDADS